MQTVVQRALDQGGARDFEALVHRAAAHLQRRLQLSAHLRLAEPNNFTIRFEAAESLHRQRPIGRTRHAMNPAVMVVGKFGERQEAFVTPHLLVIAAVARQLSKKIKGQQRRRVFLRQDPAGKGYIEFGRVGAGNRGAMMIDPEDAGSIAYEGAQMLGGFARVPRKIGDP